MQWKNHFGILGSQKNLSVVNKFLNKPFIFSKKPIFY